METEVLQKALQTATSTSNLYQTDLAPQIYDILLKELPLITLFGTEQAQGPVHQFRKRASLPQAWVNDIFNSFANYIANLNLNFAPQY